MEQFKSGVTSSLRVDCGMGHLSPPTVFMKTTSNLGDPNFATLVGEEERGGGLSLFTFEGRSSVLFSFHFGI